MDAKDKDEFFGRGKKDTSHLLTLCTCGCPMGVHYFKILPGAPMCSTCTTCRLFVPANQQPEPLKEVSHV